MGSILLEKSAGGKHLLLGNEAIVRGALEAGVGFISCYPGTPSSEVPDTFFRISKDGPFTFEYSVNEKVALEVGAGAALAGASTLVTMKHVGVNVAADPLMTLAYVGAPGGLVLLSADDPGCHSSQNEQDNRFYARLAGIPCFEPATAQECKDMAKDALELSRRFEHPVLLRTTTRVNHVRGPVVFDALPEGPERKPYVKSQRRHVPIPAFSRLMRVDLLERMKELTEVAETSPYNVISGSGEIGFVASGISRAYLRDALADLGLLGKVKVLDLGMTYPLPEKLLLNFLSGLTKVVVLEELEPILEDAFRALAQRRGLELDIEGKGDILPQNGEYSVRLAARAVAAAAGLADKPVPSCPPEEKLPMRPPNLCAGCPHRASYYAVREVFGDDAVYSSDIGCYTLGLLPPFSAADFLICMGSSVSAGSGFSKASGMPVVAFIGDSTFFHSGITGLVNAVFNNHDLILVILDNRTTAMTGHQPHPGVDETIYGENASKVDMEALIRACGVEPVVVNPLNHKSTKAALAKMKEEKGVRVLMAVSPCPIHSKRMGAAKKGSTAKVAGDPSACVSCRDQLACPAFAQENGAFAINSDQCSGCMYRVQLSDDIKPMKRG